MGFIFVLPVRTKQYLPDGTDLLFLKNKFGNIILFTYLCIVIKNKQIMKPNFYVEGDKLMAEFLGWELSKSGKKFRRHLPPFGYVKVHPNHLKFRKSWDWLILVLAQIESWGYCTNITHRSSLDNEYHICKIYKSDINSEFGQYLYYDMGNCEDSKFEAVYRACINFIKWFNSFYANNTNDVSEVVSILNLSDDEKLRRVKNLYTPDEVAEVLGYYEGYSSSAFTQKEYEKLEDLEHTNTEEFENLLYLEAITNGNFEESIRLNLRLPI